MKVRFLPFLMLPILGMAQANSNGEVPLGGNTSSERQTLEIKRNASFNLEEIKVRWKKVALENCQGAPCVVIPPAPSFTCGTSTISDKDNNVYNTVLIGTQCWTKQNLKVSKYNDGTAIPLDNSGNSMGTSWPTWAFLTTGSYVIYANESSSLTNGNASNYGYLYNWYAATDSRKLCPVGWHVPTDTEWTNLIQYIDPASSAVSNGSSFNAAKKLHANSPLWTPFNYGTDDYGFSALPGGTTGTGTFEKVNTQAFFWSDTEYDINFAWYRGMDTPSLVVFREKTYRKQMGASVRCLKD
jgi:uncharacterized protein (TIGR02145 family)